MVCSKTMGCHTLCLPLFASEAPPPGFIGIHGGSCLWRLPLLFYTPCIASIELSITVGGIFDAVRNRICFSAICEDDEPDTVVEETAHLAPRGVPSNTMARYLSKQNLEGPRTGMNNNEGGYGTNNPASTTQGGFLGVPGGGGYAGEGQNYSSDYNMNTTSLGPPVDGVLTRRALVAAFNPKGILARASSPEAYCEYEFIKRDFKAYEEVTSMDRNFIENENAVSKHQVLMSPSLKPILHNPQPEKQSDVAYDWLKKRKEIEDGYIKDYQNCFSSLSFVTRYCSLCRFFYVSIGGCHLLEYLAQLPSQQNVCVSLQKKGM